ncbi:hypothetical protein QBC46DRAFT_369128 [Diplogelasinospora grovesii]|uniref:WD40 repeat-like protein n=1 Tax=Diplogelasinospora grovesii TaxID=303347 RepID=A0AAN6SA85_9PEZI|nr:hypothetical protein QBC46DRAFT_369128 [Diplogelasinospora grovesii]
MSSTLITTRPTASIVQLSPATENSVRSDSFSSLRPTVTTNAAEATTAEAGLSEPAYKRARHHYNHDSSAQPSHDSPTQWNGSRWELPEVFESCLKDQVFPAIDREIAKLHRDTLNTVDIGKQEYQLHPPSIGLRSPALPPAPITTVQTPRTETPVPVPKVPFVPPSVPKRAVSAAATQLGTERRYSNSPIPLPVIPGQPPKTSNGVNNVSPASAGPQRPVPALPVTSTQGLRTEPIVISDDEDTPQTAQRPITATVTATTTFRPPVRRSPSSSPERRLRVPPSPHLRSPSPEVQFCPPPPLASATADDKVQPTDSHPNDATKRLSAEPSLAGTASTSPVVRRSSVLQQPNHVPTSPHNFRSRAHALAWHANRVAKGSRADTDTVTSGWFSKARRPYIRAEERQLILNGTRKLRINSSALPRPSVFHVDFSPQEIKIVQRLTREILDLPPEDEKGDTKKGFSKILRRNRGRIPNIITAIQRTIPHRNTADLHNFFKDAVKHKTSKQPAILALERDDLDHQGDLARSSRVQSLLSAREISGLRDYRAMRRRENFPNEFRKCREDDLELRAKWVNCAGDIATIVWVSNDGFICGTTEHSDAHNQQYNKPGNLVLGSCSAGTLRAYPDHRMLRPVISEGANSTNAMRESQDAWLYSSVVSSDYDAPHDRAFTSGFDRTVKIWKVDPSGASMTLLGEWKHGGNVNFVAASRHGSGMVATAADVAFDAVRVYTINESDLSASGFRSHSCSRVTDAEGNTVPTDKWAYFPATMQWGIAPSVSNLLLVGYSPRSRTGDDNDIPEDRRDSGELCLWDGLTGERWRVTSATTQNVFEVLWHPTQPCFVAATSPLGLELEDGVRTQIRIFRISDNPEYDGKAFSPIKTLDCTAVDINELTIMPNSWTYCYITAGCTDGNTYVWDTAQGDQPIHVLRHGDPCEECRGDREREDMGVKFTAWGNTPDRFYTGSSDGVVKVWNVRSLDKKPLVRDLLTAAAPISSGMFSPDRSKLVIGDASGKVFYLSLDTEEKPQVAPLWGQSRTIRCPTQVIPHPEPPPPPPPTHDSDGNPLEPETGVARGHAYLTSQQLRLTGNPIVGAVQGPRYFETGLFRRELHFNGDPDGVLMAYVAVQQQEERLHSGGRRREDFMPLRPVRAEAVDKCLELHQRNTSLDQQMLVLGLGGEGMLLLPEDTRQDLEQDGVDFELALETLFDAPDYDFEYEDDVPGEEEADDFSSDDEFYG